MNHPRFSIACVTAFVLMSACAVGQSISDRQLLKEDPFDLIVLRAGGQTSSHRVLPLRFAERRAPSPFPSGFLKVRLVNQPGADYEIAWGDIQQIVLFERALLARGIELTNEKNFDRAFDFFARLHRDFPELADLPEATERYLLANVNQAFRDREYDTAVALLLSINDRYPDSPTLARAVDAVGGKLIEARVAERDFSGARLQLDILQQRFGNLDLTIIDTWQSRFKKAADAKAREARQSLDTGDVRQARAAVLQATSVWPTHAASRQLEQEINRRFPQLLVGVTTPAPAPNDSAVVRIDAPGAWRTAPLLTPTVTQLVGYSGEGGEYASPLGAVRQDDTGRYLELEVSGDRTPYALARWLAHATNVRHANYRPVLAGLVSSVRVDAPDRVVISLARSHFRPESLLKEVSLASVGLTAASINVLEHDADHLSVQIASGAEGTTPRQIEELIFPSDEAAVAALGSGAIDMIADVPPWRLEALRENRDTRVERYRLPTVHGLIPTRRHPLLDQREFRRALVYGINRERILKEVLLGDRDEPGYRQISGPFPFGVSTSDPVRYAYNDAIEPRPFDPRLSVILTAVAWGNVQQAEADGDADDNADEGEEPEAAPLPILTLAHASDPLARTACQAIQLQLAGLGIELELVELSEAELLADDPEFDLRYAEIAMWEPVVDAPRLLGPGGLTGRCSDPMRAALRKLYNARNTRQVQFSLYEIHRLAHGDLPFLPLWQTSKHLAYHKRLAGVPSAPVNLYTSAPQWRKELTATNSQRSF